MAGRKGKCVCFWGGGGSCQTELSSGEPRCQHSWGSRARSRSSSRLTRPTKPWARQLAGAPVDRTFLQQWLFLSAPSSSPSSSPPSLLFFHSVFASLKIPLLAFQSSACNSAITVFQCSSVVASDCLTKHRWSLQLLNSNVHHYSNYLCWKF